MRLFDILKKPIVTEKSSQVQLKNTTYVVEVREDATKIDIKKAVKDVYGVDVASVGIAYNREKTKQGRKKRITRRAAVKKAYITLQDKAAKIDFTLLKI